MATFKSLAAAAILVLSADALLAACDDYPEDMAVAAAQSAAKLAEMPAQPQQGAAVEATAPTQAEGTNVAAADAKAAAEASGTTARQ
jgi:hypothetical protein